jgi:rRNA maturation endonuclease Nob1
MSQSTEEVKFEKQCYACYAKYNGACCTECFSTLHWDLTKGEGRKESGIYLTGNLPTTK